MGISDIILWPTNFQRLSVEMTFLDNFYTRINRTNKIKSEIFKKEKRKIKNTLFGIYTEKFSFRANGK